MLIIGEEETRDNHKLQRTSRKHSSYHTSQRSHYDEYENNYDSSSRSSSRKSGEHSYPVSNEIENNVREITVEGTVTTVNPQIEIVITQEENHAEEQTIDASKTLDPEVLEAISKRLDTNILKGPPIHDDIQVCWNDIFKKGLPKEETKELVKKYAIPENCSLAEPPKLNPEIKASLLEPLIKRDEKMIWKQQKVTVCLADLG